MRLAWNQDTKTLATGAGVALACGLMLGGAMRPDFGDDGRPAGPQQIAGWAGARSTGPFDPGVTYASYGSTVPDYVLGTDWKRPPAPANERAAVSEPRPQLAHDELPGPADESWARPVTRTVYQDPPQTRRERYPSQGGGVAPKPPEPEDEDEPAVVSG